MAITPLPTPPSTGSPATFDSRADNFLGALPLFATQANELAASLNNISTTSTSETELTISVGEKTLTAETGKSYATGQSVKIASTANGSIWMIGDVQSYDVMTGALVVDVQAIQGAGTVSDWTLTLSFNGLISQPQAEGAWITGSTSNGSYTKAPDGTMICTFTANDALAANTATGNIFWSASEYVWTYPAEFVGTPNVDGTARSSANNWLKARPTSSTQAAARLYAATSSATLIAIELTAIGKWK